MAHRSMLNSVVTPGSSCGEPLSCCMARTLLLDIDGTLVDSNDAHARAWVTAFSKESFEVSFEQVRPLIGMGADRLVPCLTDVQQETPRFEAISHGWQRAFEPELPLLRPFPGTRPLVQAAQDAGWQVIVVTSGEADLADALLQLADVADLLPDRVISEEGQANKPEPDLLHTALRKSWASPQDVWLLGDSKYDVEAAHKAGIKCATVRAGRNREREGADAIFDTLANAQQLFRNDSELFAGWG